MLLHHWYDVTDYEGFSRNSRRGKSPLGFLTFMTNNTLRKDSVQELLYWTPFQHWFRIKKFSNLPFLFIWAIWRIFLCILTMTLMIDKSQIEEQGGIPENQKMVYPNATFYYCSESRISFGNGIHQYIARFVCVYATSGLLYNIFQFLRVIIKRKPEYMYMQLKNGNVAVSFWFFRLTQIIYLLAVVMITVYMVQHSLVAVDSIISDIGHLLFVLVAFSSLLFFMEQLSAIGIYIITMKHLLMDIFYFCILYVLCVVPFLLFFIIFMNRHSKQGCISAFSDYPTSFYSMFMVMLNMINFTQYDLKDPSVIYFTHVIFIFMVAILLINFLIAVMSDSASRIAQQKNILIRLEKLHALFIVDCRMSWILKRYYNYVLQNIAVVKDERIYIIDVQKIDKY